jgi:hypothetical protein
MWENWHFPGLDDGKGSGREWHKKDLKVLNGKI